MAKNYFEELEVGDEWTSPARTVTEGDVALFAGLSGDYNPLHTDAEFAADTIYGERIAHGLLILAMATGLKARLGIMDGTIMAFLGLSWEFKGAVKLGDTVRVRLRIGSKRPTSKPDRGLITQELAILNQRDEIVQTGVFTTLIKRQPGADHAEPADSPTR
ncbi:MAG TPA: MaoC/PaaZ C-terminal domain-containing protein [Herpetosiphonaceae bacterium]